MRGISEIIAGKRVRWAASLAVFLFSIFVSAPSDSAETQGPRFHLVDQDGQHVTEADFSDKAAVVHFGFTHCPVVCPTTLVEITDWIGRLGDRANDVRFVFVTVDPARDSPQQLKEYLASFDNRIVGLSGSMKDITALADGLGAQFDRREVEPGDVVISHSLLGFLMRPGWQKKGAIYMGSDARAEAVGNSLEDLVSTKLRNGEVMAPR